MLPCPSPPRQAPPCPGPQIPSLTRGDAEPEQPVALKG
jgi:hypothetical protein